MRRTGTQRKGMNVVVDLAQQREDKAAKEYRECKEAVDLEIQRLDDIENYYQEYTKQFNQQTQGLRAKQMMARRDFLKQLAQTRDTQKFHIQQLREQLTCLKQTWVKQHLKKENLATYVDTIRQDENKAEERKDQKQLDDWISQTHGR